jgi:hypothetical protein
MLANHIESIHIHLAPSSLLPQFGPDVMAAMERHMRRSGRAEPEPAASAADVGAPPASGVVWPGQGGLFICTVPAMFGMPMRHLIAATEERDGLMWGERGEDVAGAASQFDGAANTLALLRDGGGETPAAQYAANHQADGHEDFFLGSRFEMLMCYWHAPQLFQKAGWYATSSQYSRHYAWAQDFEFGDSNDHCKAAPLRVRPLRCIHL